MPRKQKDMPREYVLILDGKHATDAEYKRIVNGRARKSKPKDRATAPIETVSRGFKLLR